MSFDRRNLPDATAFYEERGLKLTGRGKWRTTSCTFHGGSDSMRINVESGAFVCMAGCGARGGDVLAYHMATTGDEFIEAAKALGCWIDDGQPSTQHKPSALSPRQALELLAAECLLVAIAGANVAHGVLLNEADRRRVLQAAGRIENIARLFA